jgi:hypothetical protein
MGVVMAGPRYKRPGKRCGWVGQRGPIHENRFGPISINCQETEGTAERQNPGSLGKKRAPSESPTKGLYEMVMGRPFVKPSPQKLAKLNEELLTHASGGNGVGVKVSLMHGADADTRDALGRTPLMALAGSKPMDCELFEHDHKAAATARWLKENYEDGLILMAENLIEHGAEPGAEDGSGRMAAIIAEENGYTRLAALLKISASKRKDDEARAEKTR